jgi:precorrin-6y C5,15-methyltransferase (decarboxylating) CbiE subunit
MAVNDIRIAIVGCGPGSPEYVTEAARRAVARAEVLAGGLRLLAMFPDYPGERIPFGADTASLLDRVGARRAAGRRVAVLVSGDPGVYSLAEHVIRRFGRENCELIPGISSVQVAFARLGLGWSDAKIVNAHGQIPDLSAEDLSRSEKIAILGGTKDALRWSARIAEALQETHAALLAENLTLENERIRPVAAEQLGRSGAASLSIVLLVRRS